VTRNDRHYVAVTAEPRLSRHTRCGGLVAAVGALLVVCLAGCGSSVSYLNGAVVERSIASSFLSQQHVYARVLCPSRIPQRKGHAFQCDAGFDVGSYAVPVTEVNSAGHVQWRTRAPVHLLSVSKVTEAIRRSVLGQRGARSTDSCPARVLQQKGLVFTCQAVVRFGTARVPRRSYPFRVVEADDAGHVTYAQG
jgi:hypothetical protein